MGLVDPIARLSRGSTTHSKRTAMGGDLPLRTRRDRHAACAGMYVPRSVRCDIDLDTHAERASGARDEREKPAWLHGAKNPRHLLVL